MKNASLFFLLFLLTTSNVGRAQHKAPGPLEKQKEVHPAVADVYLNWEENKK